MSINLSSAWENEAGSTFGVFLVLTSYYKSGHAALDQRRVRVATVSNCCLDSSADACGDPRGAGDLVKVLGGKRGHSDDPQHARRPKGRHPNALIFTSPVDVRSSQDAVRSGSRHLFRNASANQQNKLCTKERRERFAPLPPWFVLEGYFCRSPKPSQCRSR